MNLLIEIITDKNYKANISVKQTCEIPPDIPCNITRLHAHNDQQ